MCHRRHVLRRPVLETPVKPVFCTREEVLEDLCDWLSQAGITSLFAYNAGFDRNHLPELRGFNWYDIMRIAVYRQHNPKIPASACMSL